MPYKTYLYISILLVSLFAGNGCSSLNTANSSCKQWTPPETCKNDITKDDPWGRIDSKKRDLSDPLTLPQLLDIALKNNPSTRQAWEESRSKLAVLGQEKSKLFPKVTAGASGTREKSVAAIESGNVNDLKYGPSGRAELLLFDFGGRDAEIEAAYQDMISAGFEFNQSLQDMILELERAYYRLYSSYSALSAAEEDVADAECSLDSAGTKFQVGLASKLDKLQAEASYDNALYNLEDARKNLESAKGDLAVVLGFSADTRINIAMPDTEHFETIDKPDISEMIEDALSSRPDIQAARALFKSKKALVEGASSSLWPSVSMGGTIDHNWHKYYNEDLPREDDYAYTGYLSLSWDIFDGFYNINKKAEAEAEERAQSQKLKELELQVSSDVWKKYHQYNSALSKLKFSKAYLKNAKASYEMAFDSYGAGLKDILDLLQAQSALSEARSKLVDSEKGLFLSIAELEHAAGSLKQGDGDR